MEKKKMYKPGDPVTAINGQIGIVMSTETLSKVRNRCREGRRPGHYFAPGCCHHPDFVTQIPVFFEDGTYDVMRSMNLKMNKEIPEGKKLEIEKMIREEA